MSEKSERPAGKKRKSPARHVVVFQDDRGTVLQTSFVAHKGTVKAPAPLNRAEEDHYIYQFAGWDQDFSQVTRNMVIKPCWEKVPKKYLVLYFHEDGSMLGMESVPYGQAAACLFHPEKSDDEEYEYPFIGWNCDLTAIKGDTSAKAIFGRIRKIFTVRFFQENGDLLKEEKVHYHEPAHPPASPEKARDSVYYYEFAGWVRRTGGYTGDGSPINGGRTGNGSPIDPTGDDRQMIDQISQSVDFYPVFHSIFRDYRISFFDEDIFHSSLSLHYGEEIVYPGLRRKGYDLHWDQQLSRVEGDAEIHASWQFSNPAGRILQLESGLVRGTSLRPAEPVSAESKSADFTVAKKRDGSKRKGLRIAGEFCILNPSSHHGTVSCLSYFSSEKTIRFPERVLLGDYYYDITEIGPDCFKDCGRMQTLILPRTVRRIRDRALADCGRLKKLVIKGKDVKLDKDIYGKR